MMLGTLNRAALCFTAGLAALSLASLDALAEDRTPVPKRDYLITPDVITTKDGRRVEVERGLIIVPENRRDPNSRDIAVHFLRFPALNAGAEEREPVFALPGGPGTEFNFTQNRVANRIDALRQTRPVVYVSQRGYPKAPGLVPDMRFSAIPPAAPNRSITEDVISAGFARSYSSALKKWSDRGVDVTGYDIFNITDDVYDLRTALGYDKIVLRGCSFGSQLSFAYMKRWPQTVDRAMLSGVEPLDYGYDSPKWFWNFLERFASEAEQNKDLAPHLPKVGLLKALRTVFDRLEKEPVTVTVINPKTGGNIGVTVGATELRFSLFQMTMFRRGSHLRDLEVWPRFITELYEGDYHFLGMTVLGLRSFLAGGGMPLILPLIDNSLGISEERDERLLAEKKEYPSIANIIARATRGIKGAAPQVPQNFLEDFEIDVPVLLVNGSYDWNTPLENAQHAREFLKSGHLTVVEGGTHCPIYKTDQLPKQRPETTDALNAFIDADFSKISPTNFFAKLPRTVTLDPLNFEIPSGISLYEEMLSRQR